MVYKDFILGLLKKSSLIAKEKFGHVSSTIKQGDNNQVLTEADLEIGRVLVEQIKKDYPDHNIIDEESGVIDNGSEFTWVIDPVDGTSNFAAGIHMYGVIIGLLKDDLPIAGGVALPAFDEIYFAEKGYGAYRNETKISVNKGVDLIKMLVAYGIDSHLEDTKITEKELRIIGQLVNKIQNLRCTNSVYDAMMVAEGKFGAYLNRSMRIWDIVGPQVIIEEAGGVVTDFTGNKIDYTDAILKWKEHFTFISSAPNVFKEIVKITS